ncbi:MAG TPA: FHA domain-containing protein [Gammaproteobacteria bacterium]|jgi:pSer/pThr/pTyr-binding forkhead associated (FHA) protein|nr:FHA domain-containing protein [Gammaproteobacteria bacterium]
MSKTKQPAATLVLLVDGVVAKEFLLDKAELTIGRRAGNDIRVDDVAVSGQHARILVAANRYLDGAVDVFIEDLNSTNGTRVNGETIQRCRLNHGDLIQIGWNNFKLLDERQSTHEQTAYIIRE